MWDSNPRVPVPQTGVLTNFTNTAMAGIEGIEPPLTVLETAVLPLYYIPIISPLNLNS